MNLRFAHNRTRRGIRLGAVALSICFASCNQSATNAALDSAELTKAVDDLGKVFQDAAKSKTFAPAVISLGAVKPSGFAAKLSSGMTDTSFSFDGVEYSNLKSKLSHNTKALAQFGSIDKSFGSMNDMFAAHGITAKVQSVDLVAYVKVASVALSALSHQNPNAGDFDAVTLARALHVAVALSAIPLGEKKASLSLDKTTADVDFCGQFNKSATTNKSWICAKDDIGGSIGYMAGDKVKVWNDAFAGKSFAACPDSAISSDGASWGWIPDKKKPGGGTSCHRNIPIRPEAVKIVCAQGVAAGYNSGDCRGSSAKGSTPSAAAPDSNAAADDDSDGED
ncbi:MAG: hypothetical protein NTZ90_12040 [Proteobacteria bacterium]|nr:hypothetical protein [Pseudomonadota bacterium]